MLKIILQFVISGTVVVIATAIGQKVGQKWAGLLVAFPFWTILTYLFLSTGNRSTNHHAYLVASLVFMIPAAAFIAALLLLYRSSMWIGLAGGLSLYLVSVLIVNKIA